MKIDYEDITDTILDIVDNYSNLDGVDDWDELVSEIVKILKSNFEKE